MNIKSIKMNKDFLIPGGFGTLFVCENIISDDKTITLSPGYDSDLNISFKVLFKNGHVKTTNEHMTLNELPVVVNRYGTLVPIPNHKIVETENYYYTLQANTILEMYYTDNYDGNDNPAFVVVGNPVVLSSTDYTIYADGKVGDDVVGTVKEWPLLKIPYGWKECNGQAISRTDYSELFQKFSTQPIVEGWETYLVQRYGTGDGSTTFNLPDYQETALVGVGTNVKDHASIRSDDIYTLGEFKDDAIRSHVHNRGNMNISGKFLYSANPNGINISTVTGAFSFSDIFNESNSCDTGSHTARTIYFDANRSWSGYTGSTLNSDWNNAYSFESAVTRGKQKGVKYIIKVL